MEDAWALMRNGCDDQPHVILTPTNYQAHCCAMSGLLCASFQCGKRVCTRSGARYSKEIGPYTLKAEDLVPGQKVSVDQYLSK
eukprot:4406468-Ditylum_brightwellii.AAC.1